MSVTSLRRHAGFTIVELLIVIVVIGILAAITIVAYNGVQNRTKNSSTVSAATAWLKAIRMYESEKGYLPIYTACLGTSYSYDEAMNASGTYQCRQDSSSSGVNESATFNTELAPYISNKPTPAFVTASNSSTAWRRGIIYLVNGSTPGSQIRIDIVLAGVSTCPTLGGLNATFNSFSNGNAMCAYPIGARA